MSTTSISFTIRKKYVQISEWWKRLKKKKFSKVKPDINSTQTKTIELFYTLIKDKNTKLNYSKNSHTRVIDSEFVWMTMTSSDLESYVIQVIDETRRHTHSHDVLIPKEYGYEMVDEFDEELEKRFRSIEAAKINTITADLDILIKKVKNQYKQNDQENISSGQIEKQD